MRIIAAVFGGACLIVSASAHAAQWVQLEGYADTYVDTDSVRTDAFPKVAEDGRIHHDSGRPETEAFAVAWVWVKPSFARIAIAFDCRGNMGILQQVILDEAPNSSFDSFDFTALFREDGVRKRSVPPDTAFEAAGKLACTLKPPVQQGR